MPPLKFLKKSKRQIIAVAYAYVGIPTQVVYISDSGMPYRMILVTTWDCVSPIGVTGR